MSIVLENAGPSEGIENLIDIAVSLADFTQTVERSQEIPDFLSRMLGVPQVALAVVRHSADDAEPHLVVFSAANHGTAGRTNEALSAAGMLTVYRGVKGLMRENGPAIEMMRMDPGDDSISRCGEEQEHGSTHRMVFAHAMDRSHLMCLVIGPRGAEADGSAELSNNWVAIARELFKQLHCLVTWHASPWALGAPFDRLSQPEWMVLHGLDSDASEKQLAAQLNFRPHTLHSHIKSIYHKIGVQGRLPLLVHFHARLRQMRIEIHGAGTPSERSHGLTPTGK